MRLKLEVQISETYQEELGKFLYEKETLELEHSLYTISKWESRWKKPYLLKDYKMTPEEILDYISCMLVNEKQKSLTDHLKEEHILKINEYINDPMSATTITRRSEKKNSNKIVTSEVLYTKMVFAGVPFECQHWHLNRLLKLLEVIDAEANPKKMSRKETMDRYRELNRQRRKKLNSKG